MKIAGLVLFFLCSIASGAVVSVSPTGLGAFVLDIDSDGFAEFENFGYSPEENLIAFEFHVDGINASTTFPDDVFVGIRGDTFASKEALVASTMFSGDLVVPQSYARLYDSITGVSFINGANPIFAAWMYGSLGTGSDELRLLGMVVDATGFFSSGGTANLNIFFHDYGSFAGGQSITGASLSQTGINTGASSQLDADVEFMGPKSGLMRVVSKLGSSYRLKKGSVPGDGITIATLAGTGGVLTLSWDDSGSSDEKAFFWVEEFTP
ncbi:MAG: hypothetical protein ACRCXD_08950 [Luteolibacter sp.]